MFWNQFSIRLCIRIHIVLWGCWRYLALLPRLNITGMCFTLYIPTKGPGIYPNFSCVSSIRLFAQTIIENFRLVSIWRCHFCNFSCGLVKWPYPKRLYNDPSCWLLTWHKVDLCALPLTVSADAAGHRVQLWGWYLTVAASPSVLDSSALCSLKSTCFSLQESCTNWQGHQSWCHEFIFVHDPMWYTCSTFP